MESRIKDAEAIITHTFYLTKEQLKRSHKLPDSFHDDVTKFLLEAFPAWGYQDTRNLVAATERYARKAVFLESYSGAIYAKFENRKQRKESAKNDI